MKEYKTITKKKFYGLSFTWGLPMSLVGLIVYGVLRCFGYKANKYGYCYHIEIGGNWGGLNLGWVFLTGKNASKFTKNHELGHAYQNALIFGWVMPIMTIISATRYWISRLGVKLDYYAWSFESEANRIGGLVMEENI